MIEAVEAAAHWKGGGLRLIRARENAVYEMRVPGGRAALRLHRAGYQEAAAIRSELWWCDALAGEGVPVSTPLAAVSGDLLVQLSSGRFASAIRWIEGEALGEAGVPLAGTLQDQAERHHALGVLVAQMHDATDRLTLPETFTRPRWDVDGLTGDTPFWGRFWEHPILNADQAGHMQRARKFLRQRLIALPSDPTNFGPIHADVLRENVIVKGRSLSLIDFDDSGMGFRHYDLGTVLSQDIYQPNFTDLRAALIAGYQTRRIADIETVDLFTMARCLASVGWAAPRLPPDHPVHASHIARAILVSARVMGQTTTG